jgi:hypothetical protein
VAIFIASPRYPNWRLRLSPHFPVEIAAEKSTVKEVKDSSSEHIRQRHLNDTEKRRAWRLMGRCCPWAYHDDIGIKIQSDIQGR